MLKGPPASVGRSSTVSGRGSPSVEDGTACLRSVLHCREKPSIKIDAARAQQAEREGLGSVRLGLKWFLASISKTWHRHWSGRALERADWSIHSTRKEKTRRLSNRRNVFFSFELLDADEEYKPAMSQIQLFLLQIQINSHSTPNFNSTNSQTGQRLEDRFCFSHHTQAGKASKQSA